MTLEFAGQTLTDQRTLVRAVRNYALEQPPFALAAGMLGHEYISRGHHCDITNADVLDAYFAVMQAAAASGIEETAIHAAIRHLLAYADG